MREIGQFRGKSVWSGIIKVGGGDLEKLGLNFGSYFRKDVGNGREVFCRIGGCQGSCWREI